ncbi:MAG TPA: hypothetical protein VNO54_06675 [Streptosporangiaceae bacterium]|nr:hypothetical protein [Streptosporangiaceae bacterium]
MATVTAMRSWLRDHGEDVPERGRLNADMIARYETGQHDPDWDTAGDGDTISADETEPSTPMQPERPPRTQRSSRRDRRSRPISERIAGKRDGKKPPGRKKPRMSVEHLISRSWEAVARFAAPLSLPVSRCLQVQSPVAGLIIEDVVAGTMIDRALQPIARAEEKAEKVIALIAPPILVLGIEQSFLLPPEQMMMRQAILMPLLRESLRVWLQVAGPKVEEAAAKEAEYQEKFGRSIDEMIALFFPAASVAAEQVPEPEAAMA